MSRRKSLIAIIREQHDATLSLNDPQVTVLAQQIAFYTAMIAAEEADPLERLFDRTVTRLHLRYQLERAFDAYVDRINELMD